MAKIHTCAITSHIYRREVSLSSIVVPLISLIRCKLSCKISKVYGRKIFTLLEYTSFYDF